MSTTKEQMRPLNTTDGWENIVNINAMQRASARERVAARKKERRLKKMWLSVCVMATIAITFLILSITGAMDGWLATILVLAMDLIGCFLLGRYVEAKKG